MNDLQKCVTELQAGLLKKLPELTAEQVNGISDEVFRIFGEYDLTRRCTDLAIADPCARDVTEYLATLKLSGRSDKTISLYRNVLRVFFADVKMPLNLIRYQDILTWMCQYRSRRNVSNATMEEYRMVIRYFFKWAKEMTKIEEDPASCLKAIKTEKKERMSLTRRQLVQVENACDDSFERAVIETLYATGCRASELISIRLQDIDWERKRIRVIGKGNKERFLMFNERAEIAMRQYIAERGEDGVPVLFRKRIRPYGPMTYSAMLKVVKTISERSGVPFTPHQMRHTTATLAIAGGMDVPCVQKMLGHSQIGTTMKYVHMTEDQTVTEYKKFVV